MAALSGLLIPVADDPCKQCLPELWKPERRRRETDGQFSGKWNYPKELPVVEHREEILAAIKSHQVVVVVSDTGSGKTTQLPKMVAEAMGPEGGRIGCTQPRRIAAASVAKRVAEELMVPLGGYVGYQVRFEDKTTRETRIKFMTDGILLAETQGDPELRQYEVLILDEAHERSLNIDFLLGYLKRLLTKRRDLRLVISSATLDAGSFAAFFSDDGTEVPVIEAPGRMFPVAEFFLPPSDDEDLPQHVARAVDWLAGVEPRGDVLVFLPGEREIRECAEVLDGRRYPGTEVLPLFARLGLADQQRVFNPGQQRRLILATNVAETSLTIPRIACVIDSGIARVNRWSPGKGVQRLQIEPVSKASARQRKGRCGRVRDGVCVRLYEETELEERPDFTDPEIRRSSLAGVILRMKSLGLPEIEEFPFLDPPSPKAISEGYRTLREVDALDRDKNLTENGRRMARLPVDPRLGRMLIEASKEHCLAEMLPIIAALESNDPRERPAEKIREADAAHARWKDIESDFIGILRLWRDVSEFRDERGRWKRNALRKFAAAGFLNARRVIEWANVADELTDLLRREWDVRGELGKWGTRFPMRRSTARCWRVCRGSSACGTGKTRRIEARAAGFSRCFPAPVCSAQRSATSGWWRWNWWKPRVSGRGASRGSIRNGWNKWHRISAAAAMARRTGTRDRARSMARNP